MSIEAIINGVIEVEGGYVNHPSDPGGATNMGSTEAGARSAGYKGDMRNLPRSTAYSIYYTRYVVAPNFDDVFARDPKVAEELIDSGVNAGTDRAAKWFQAALNSLNRRKARGKSATAIMLRALDALQGAHYMSLAKGNSKFEDFLNGWLLNRIGNVAA